MATDFAARFEARPVDVQCQQVIRQTERVRIGRGARLELTAGNGAPAHAAAVWVRDVSTRGFRFETMARFPIGSEVVLEVAPLGAWPAVVRWQLGGSGGAQFVDPLSHSALLLLLLNGSAELEPCG
jgi:hypothetical protein